MRPPKPPTWTRISVIYLHNQPAAFIWSLYFFSHITSKKIIIFGCTRSSLLCMGFLYLPRTGATLCCCAQASHCSGISYCGAQALGMWASVAVVHRLVHRLSSCGSLALMCRLSSWCMGLAAPWYVGASWIRDQTRVPCIGRWISIHRATREASRIFNWVLLTCWSWGQEWREKEVSSFLFF